jgi:hypothetical protein
LNWLEELRAFLRPIPHYTKTAGSPEGVIDGVKGDRYYDTTDNLIYYKTTDTGNTGWVALSQPIAGLGVWRYRTETDATPASGRMQFDSTTIASVTEMYVNVTNLAGTDVSVILATIVANDLLYVQVQNSADQFIVIQTGAPSVSAGVYTFPVNAVVGQGTGSGVANNTPVIIVTG